MDSKPGLKDLSNEELLEKLFKTESDRHQTFSDEVMKKIQQNLLDLDDQVRKMREDGEFPADKNK